MSLIDMAEDAARRQAELERLRKVALQKAARSDEQVVGLSDAVRQLVDSIDFTHRQMDDIALKQAECRRSMPTMGRVALAAGAATAGALALLALGSLPGYIPGIAAGVLGATTFVSGMTRWGQGQYITWGDRERACLADVAAQAQAKLQATLNQERATHEGGLLSKMSAAGGTGAAADLAFMEHVESDPAVAVATLKYQKLEHGVAHKQEMLQSSRERLFAGEKSRMEAMWSDMGEAAKTCGLLTMMGCGIGPGIGAGMLFGANIGWAVGLAGTVGGLWLYRKLAPKVMARMVERRLRSELSAEVERERPQIPGARQAYHDELKSVMDRYQEILKSTPLPPPPVRPGVEDVLTLVTAPLNHAAVSPGT